MTTRSEANDAPPHGEYDDYGSILRPFENASLAPPAPPKLDSDRVGVKLDANKPRWELLEWDLIEDIVKVLTWGAEQKYADRGWQTVPNARERYFASAVRHLVRYRQGQLVDPDTGLSSLAHVGCNLMILDWHERHQK